MEIDRFDQTGPPNEYIHSMCADIARITSQLAESDFEEFKIVCIATAMFNGRVDLDGVIKRN